MEERVQPDEHDHTTVEVHPNSSLNFDSDYFVILCLKIGLLQSDATLIMDAQANWIVSEVVISSKFFTEFARSMKRIDASSRAL